MNTAQHFKICLRDHKNREMVFNVKPTTTWSKIKVSGMGLGTTWGVDFLAGDGPY
jgi:hypothetical protein